MHLLTDTNRRILHDYLRNLRQCANEEAKRQTFLAMVACRSPETEAARLEFTDPSSIFLTSLFTWKGV